MGENPERLEGVTTLQMLAERRGAGGSARTNADIPLLLESRDLIAIGMMADDVRRQQHGVETTFVRVLEIHVDAVPSSLPQGVSAGEFRLVGAPSSLDAACAAVAQAKRLAGGTPVTGFSLSDLAALESSGGYAFGRLRDAGLDAVADTPVDRDDRSRPFRRPGQQACHCTG